MSGRADRFRVLARRTLLWRAVDVTDHVGPRSALVVAPHPDDETLGCGGRILLSRRSGARVTLAILSDGGAQAADSTDPGAVEHLIAIRRSECSAAAERLGVPADDVRQLSYPDGRLIDYAQELVDAMVALIDEVRPDDVYVTCAQEWHIDHAAASRITRAAVAQLSNPPRLLEYPIWLWSDWPISRRYRDGSGLRQLVGLLVSRRIERIDLTAVRSDKRAALAAYASQIGGPRALDDLDTGTESAAPGLGRELITRTLDGPELYFRPRIAGQRGSARLLRRGKAEAGPRATPTSHPSADAASELPPDPTSDPTSDPTLTPPRSTLPPPRSTTSET